MSSNEGTGKKYSEKDKRRDSSSDTDSSEEFTSLIAPPGAGQLRFRGTKGYDSATEDVDGLGDIGMAEDNSTAAGGDDCSDSFDLGCNIVNILAEVVFAYLWWSIFLATPEALWFSTIHQMKWSGLEVLSLLLLSPVLMRVESVRDLVMTPSGLMLVRMMTLVGVVSFLTSPNIVRSILLAVGCSCGMLALIGSLWSKHEVERYRHGYLHMLGYLLYLAVRIWGSSFNYIFINTYLNIVGVCVGVVTSVILYFNDSQSPTTTDVPPSSEALTTPVPLEDCATQEISNEDSAILILPEDYTAPAPREDIAIPEDPTALVPHKALAAPEDPTALVPHKDLAAPKDSTAPQKDRAAPENPATMISNESSVSPGSPDQDVVQTDPLYVVELVTTGVSFGAVLFLTSYLFSDVSVATRWFEITHPIQGPQPNPWGMATLLALSLGLAHYSRRTKRVRSFSWLASGVAFSILMYHGEAYPAFFSTLGLGIYSMALWPLLLRRLPAFPSATVLGVAMVVYLVNLVLCVWGFASTILPGGQVIREYSHVTMIALLLCCGVGTCEVLIGNKEGNESLIQQVLKGPSSKRRPEEKFHKKVVRGGVILILIFGAVGYFSRRPVAYQAPIKMQEKTFAAGIWSVQFGHDNQGWPNVERAAQFIKNSEVEVIGLLKTDASRPFIGGHDIASWLGERLHMYIDYGPGIVDNTRGVTLLSKHPIIDSHYHELPSAKGEIGVALKATVNISGQLVDVFVAHFSSYMYNEDRKLQAEMTVKLLKNCTHPVVFLGHLNSEPGCRDYSIITEVVKDIESRDTERFQEYIFYRNLSKLAYARISHGGLSDCEMQIGKFLVGSEDTGSEWVYSIHPDDVPDWMSFPEMFGERWVGEYHGDSRHHFHMGTPKYYYV